MPHATDKLVIRHMHVGDTLRPFRHVLRRKTGDVVDLTDKAVTFSMYPADSATPVVDRAEATIIDAEGGVVEFKFSPQHVAAPGVYFAYWHVTQSNETETFPPEMGLLKVQIHGPV